MMCARQGGVERLIHFQSLPAQIKNLVCNLGNTKTGNNKILKEIFVHPPGN